MAMKNTGYHFPLKLNIAMQQVPLKALDPKSRDIVCDGLNQNIVSTTASGIIRNYYGFAELTGCFEYDEIQTLSHSENPTGQLLDRWQDVPGITIGKLLDLLAEVERFDILDDLSRSLKIEQLAETIGLKLLSHASWSAFQPIRRTRMVVNKTRVVFIHHSVFVKEDLYLTVRSLQSCKIIFYGHDDLNYNFLVGQDGTVFEGRGWGVCGSHTRRYNNLAIGIGLLGDYEENIPDKRMLDAVLKCIELGVTLGKIHPNYGIYPHLDASDTNSPGRFTLEAISSWPRFRALGPLPLPEKLREMDTWDDLSVESAPAENMVRNEQNELNDAKGSNTSDTITTESTDVVRCEASNIVRSKTTDIVRLETNNTSESNTSVTINNEQSDAVRIEAIDTITPNERHYQK